MPAYYALVDATTGREADVETQLRAQPRIVGVARAKEGNHDFLVKFEAADFSTVDDFLQTHIRRLSGVAGVEIITDWADHPQSTRDARDRLA